MKKIKIGKTDIVTSRLFLGTLPLGGESVWGDCEDSESIRTIRRACELGINSFDTAPVYGFGRSERVLGQALKNKRAECTILTKCGVVWDRPEGGDLLYSRDGHDCYRNLTEKSIRYEIGRSLKRLATDYIDIYMVHWPATAAFPVPIEETMGVLNALKKEGIIRSIGVSNLSLEQLQEYSTHGEIDVYQGRLSMLDRKSFDLINGFCLERGITFQGYSPFERGLLTGAIGRDYTVRPGDARSSIRWYNDGYREKVLTMLEGWADLREKYGCSQSALTIAWTLAQAENICLCIGTRRESSIIDNVRGGCLELTRADLERMDADIAEVLRYGTD